MQEIKKKQLHNRRTDIDEKELCEMYLKIRNKKALCRHYDCSANVINRILNEHDIESFNKPMKYKMNQHFFDRIDTEEKAYWLGFIWCDGYVSKRDRLNHSEYAFKLDLSIIDEDHVIKFRNALSSNHSIKKYKNGQRSYKSNSYICRLHISVKSFGENLYYDYGLIPNRNDVEKLKSAIPKRLMKHFIRGVLDADGSFAYYVDNKENQKKMVLHFSTYENLVIWINDYLYDEGLCNSILKLDRRHKERDAECVVLKFSGRKQVKRILNYLYRDATIYLDRKFIKYNQLLEFDK